MVITHGGRSQVMVDCGRADMRVLYPWRNMCMHVLPGNTRKSAEYSGHIVSQWPQTQEIMDDLEVFDIVP